MAGPMRDRGRSLGEAPKGEGIPDFPHGGETRRGGIDVEGEPSRESMASDEERGLPERGRTGLPRELGEGEVER
jgi:hypothetical protein